MARATGTEALGDGMSWRLSRDWRVASGEQAGITGAQGTRRPRARAGLADEHSHPIGSRPEQQPGPGAARWRFLEEFISWTSVSSLEKME